VKPSLKLQLFLPRPGARPPPGASARDSLFPPVLAAPLALPLRGGRRDRRGNGRARHVLQNRPCTSRSLAVVNSPRAGSSSFSHHLPILTLGFRASGPGRCRSRRARVEHWRRGRLVRLRHFRDYFGKQSHSRRRLLLSHDNNFIYENVCANIFYVQHANLLYEMMILHDLLACSIVPFSLFFLLNLVCESSHSTQISNIF
jgi:hypothetical protein